jgi:hypothetical protein
VLDLPQGLTFTSDSLRLDVDARLIRRAAHNGRAIRVKRGAYFPQDAWQRMLPESQHLVRVVAVAESHSRPIFSHWSAAALHGLPVVGPWPTDVHVASARASGGRSETGVRRHCRGLEAGDWTEVDGIRVTTIERTIVDLALAQPFRFAVAPADYALRLGLTTRAALEAHLDASGAFRGRGRAQRVVAFASPFGTSPGESLSRGGIHELGFPVPQLQVEHRSPGKVAFTDFEWPEYRLFGEFDGRGKYLKAELRGGLTVQEAVLAEKVREDWLRRTTGFACARWEWSDALALLPMGRILVEAGLPASRAYAAATRAGHAVRAER